MKFNLVRPCKDCPFRLDTPLGWLGSHAQVIANELTEENKTFPCHKTTGIHECESHDPKYDSHCAGALLVLEQSKQLNDNWALRLAQEWGLLDMTKLRHTVPVFETFEAFITHHCNQLKMSTITFGAATEAAKKGLKIARSGWNGKGMWVILFSQSQFITVSIEEGNPSPPDLLKVGFSTHIGDTGTRIEHIGITDTGDDFYPISDFFFLKTADNKVVPWNASQSDMLAEDWQIIP